MQSLWLIDERHIGHVHHALRQARLATDRRQASAPVKSQKRGAGKIGVVALHGLLEQRQSFAGWLMGGTDTTDFGREFDALVSDPNVGSIIVDVDSPGGSVPGTQVLSDKIYAARKVKPVFAVTNSLNASAAYWITSAATKVFAVPGSEAGSIGVRSMHIDESAAIEDAGLKVTMFSSTGAPFKTEFNSFEPLSPEAIAYEQRLLDGIHADFVAAVARNRGTTPGIVADRFGKGRVLSARDALAVGMVDEVIPSFDAVVGRVASSGARSAMMSEGERQARHRHEVRQARDRHEARMALDERRRNRLRVVSGYAVVWDVPGWTGKRWEAVSPSAFDHVLAGAADVAFCVNHRTTQPLATRRDFGLRLTKDAHGLHVEADVPDDVYGRQLVRQLDAGEFTGWSFWNSAETNSPDVIEGRNVERLIRGDLSEVSILVAPDRPTYPQTAYRLSISVC